MFVDLFLQNTVGPCPTYNRFSGAHKWWDPPVGPMGPWWGKLVGPMSIGLVSHDGAYLCDPCQWVPHVGLHALELIQIRKEKKSIFDYPTIAQV